MVTCFETSNVSNRLMTLHLYIFVQVDILKESNFASFNDLEAELKLIEAALNNPDCKASAEEDITALREIMFRYEAAPLGTAADHTPLAHQV